MASPTQWTWVWVNSGSWWWTGRPGVLWFMGSQRVGHDWVTELNWYCQLTKKIKTSQDKLSSSICFIQNLFECDPFSLSYLLPHWSVCKLHALWSVFTKYSPFNLFPIYSSAINITWTIICSFVPSLHSLPVLPFLIKSTFTSFNSLHRKANACLQLDNQLSRALSRCRGCFSIFAFLLQFPLMYVCILTCLTLWEANDSSPPASSVRGIFQARMLEWVAISYPGDCPDPGIEPEFPVLAGRFFTTVPPGKPHFLCCCLLNKHITDPLRPVIHTLCSMTNTCLPSPVPGGTLNSNHSAFQ